MACAGLAAVSRPPARIHAELHEIGEPPDLLRTRGFAARQGPKLIEIDGSQALRREVCVDESEMADLILTIQAYIDKHNDQPKPFIWTAKAADILEQVKRARAAPDNRQSA